MRKVACSMASLLLTVGLSGCQLPGVTPMGLPSLAECQSLAAKSGGPSVGVEVRYVLPSSQNVTTPVLLSQSVGSPSAQPIGGSGFLQQPLLMGPPAMAAEQRLAASPCTTTGLVSSPSRPVLATAAPDCATLEQACDRIRALEAKLAAQRAPERLPMPTAKE